MGFVRAARGAALKKGAPKPAVGYALPKQRLNYIRFREKSQ